MGKVIERPARRLEEWQANWVYDVLVSECGASPDDRHEFVFHHTRELPGEYRFQGALGFGGKFYCTMSLGGLRLGVDCYPEDLSEERQAMIERANACFKEMPVRDPLSVRVGVVRRERPSALAEISCRAS